MMKGAICVIDGALPVYLQTESMLSFIDGAQKREAEIIFFAEAYLSSEEAQEYDELVGVEIERLKLRAKERGIYVSLFLGQEGQKRGVILSPQGEIIENGQTFLGRFCFMEEWQLFGQDNATECEYVIHPFSKKIGGQMDKDSFLALYAQKAKEIQKAIVGVGYLDEENEGRAFFMDEVGNLLVYLAEGYEGVVFFDTEKRPDCAHCKGCGAKEEGPKV